MNMTQEMLEIMMGKFLDGEITPSERRLLEAELDKNPQARDLLAQLQQMHERCGEAVASALLDRGSTPDEIFERAWRQKSKGPLRAMNILRGHVRFAAGLAAGLIIGLALHFVLPVLSRPGSEPIEQTVAANGTDSEVNQDRPQYPWPATIGVGDAIRNVDWYNFTDKHGNKWLVEGLRQNSVRPAAYYGDLWTRRMNYDS